MKKNLKDLFDNFSDEIIDIKTTVNISPEKITEMTKSKIKEDNMKTKRFKLPLIAAAMIALLSITAFAAHQILSPKDIAMHVNDYKLAKNLAEIDTAFNFEPQISGDYTFQLLGIASGKRLSSFAEVNDDKSYIVGAISRTDGTPLNDISDFMVTQLVSGYKPWQVNAFTLEGGRTSFVHEGVNYFIFECSNIEIFADHTVYIAAYEGMSPGSETFVIKDDGSIDFNENYKGVKALFTVPLDKSKADPEAVKKLLDKNGITVGDDDDNGENKDFDVKVTESDNESFVVITEEE